MAATPRLLPALLCLYLATTLLHAVPPPRPTPAAAPAPLGHTLPAVSRWTFAKAPAFCRELVRNPAWAESCRRNRTSMRCEDGRYQMFSQMRQDYYLYTHHFALLKRRGIYMDVATNDPIGISNTYFFEKCMGWSGLCVEANPQYLAAIHRFRDCALVPTCVSNVDGRAVHFALHSALSGILDTNKNVRNWRDKNETVPTVKQKCTTMARETTRYNVTRADYLSLDVEGHELQVLKGIDWNKIIINVITVEAKPDSLQLIEDLLVSKGYVRHVPTLDNSTIRSRRLNEDAVFLHHDVIFGKPV